MGTGSRAFWNTKKYSSVYDNNLEPDFYIHWQGDCPLPNRTTE